MASLASSKWIIKNPLFSGAHGFNGTSRTTVVLSKLRYIIMTSSNLQVPPCGSYCNHIKTDFWMR